MELDARGKPCPQPVLMLKKALEEGALEVSIRVDNKGAVENLKRFAAGKGFKTEIKGAERDFTVEVGPAECPVNIGEETERANPVLFVSTDTLGRGSDELGKILMKAFTGTISEGKIEFSRMVFINSGVKLVCEGSELAEQFKAIEEAGTGILACGTCLDYYGLKEKIIAGKISNAYEILETLSQASLIVPFA